MKGYELRDAGIEHAPQHPMYLMARDVWYGNSVFPRMLACLKKQTDKGWVYARHVSDSSHLPPTTIFGTLGQLGMPFDQSWP